MNADSVEKLWQNSRGRLNRLSMSKWETMARTKQPQRRLSDYLQPGLQVLFVGINPGLRSAALGHHFAGHSNRFWKLLFESRLIDEPLTFREDRRLLEWRLGLTNIIGRASAGIDVLSPADYRSGLAALERKIHRYRPRTIALLGVTTFRMLFPERSGSGMLDLGATTARLGGVPVFLLPNPSGRNAHYSYQTMLTAFRSLRNAAGSL
jgi:double-stranded uracil-DNA glycosylase